MSIELIVILAGVVLFVVFTVLHNMHKKWYSLLENTETSKITTLKKGFYEVKGKVKIHENSLESPLSGKKCVYYHFRVEEKKKTGKSSTWVTMIDDKKQVKFGIEDSSGMALIELEGAKLKFAKDDKGHAGLFNEAGEELEQTLLKYNRSSKNWLFNKTLRYFEKYIREGDELYVIGEVTDFQGYYPIFRKGSSPYFISDTKEEDLISYSKKISRISLFFMLLTIAVVLGVLCYRYFIQ